MSFPPVFKQPPTTSIVDDTTKPRTVTMPQPPTPTNDVPIGVDVPPVVPAPINEQLPTESSYHTPPADSQLLPPTPSLRVGPALPEVSDNMGDIWRSINNRNISETEKMMNEINYMASSVVDAASSSDGVIGFVRSEISDAATSSSESVDGIVEDVTIKALGNAILEGVPGIMSALEALTDIHPFLRAAFLPFKLIYEQETKRRDNDQRRTTLFGKIKEVMLVLLELKDIKKNDTTRTTPDNQPVLGRLEAICKTMEKDIKECYNVLNAQERRRLAIKFLRAANWNKELGLYASRFVKRREELLFALSMRTVNTTEEIKADVKIMMEMFEKILTPQEREMGRWIRANGGQQAVLKDDKLCAEMLKQEALVVASTGIKYEASGAASSGLVGSADKGKASANEDPKIAAKAVAALRKQYHDDIQAIIQENLESYSKRFDLGLEDLGQDLGKKIQHEGDRLIRYLRGGPHQRIKDKMIYHVWKDQGWKGSAKTRLLVLALRDYFVERIEHNKFPKISKDVGQRPISSLSLQADDDDDDPETEMIMPLPDEWMASYLQIKRVRYLEQPLDPDSSGFTTISEVNAFTRARPEDWSLPRWVAYWTIGWQIYATQYCVEIEELFGQMVLLKREIAIKMPGNTRYINAYIDGCWEHVTALTSSIERYSAEPWLKEKFTGYIQSQETILMERLDKIQYDIDAVETVSLVLRDDRIEGSIFMLLALLMRRHVAKMHLCLKREIDWRELLDDMDSVNWVVWAVWIRFLDLKGGRRIHPVSQEFNERCGAEHFKHQEISDLKLIFEWLSCGLFKNYWEWGNWFQLKYFTENDTTVWTSDTIGEMEPSRLVGILAYTDMPGSKSFPLPLGWEERRTPEGRRYFLDHRTRTWTWLDPRRDSVQTAVVDAAESAAEITPTTDAESLEEHISIDQMTGGDSNTVQSKPSEAKMSITGTWTGFHWTETQKPFHPMLSFTVRLDNYGDGSESETTISGDGVDVNGNSFRLSGSINFHRPAENLVVNFARIYTDDGTRMLYNGCFQPDRGLMTGAFTEETASGSFLFKKVPTSAIMCARPMVPKLNAKELWSFALNAVLNDIRRKKPNLLYIRERMTAIRRVFEFMYRNNDSLKQVEDAKLIKTFSVEDMTELMKLYYWHLRAGDLQPSRYTCDGCGGYLIRSRVICLDCIGANTVDFCSRPDCIASERVPDRPDRPDIQHSACHLMVCLRDLFLLKDYFVMKQRAKYTLDYARFLYKDDLSLTLPLPASPIADSPTSSEAKGKEDLNVGIQTSASVILDNDPTPTPVPIAPRAPLGLPALDTVFLKSPAGDSSSPDSPSRDTPTLGPRELLSVAVTPMERIFQDVPWNCVVCHERVVAPCWSCVTCQNNAWVCDSCEMITNELSPWDYQKRYRSEVEAAGGTDDGSSHTVLHHMVRLARVNILEANPDVNNITVESTTTKVSSPLGQWEEVEKRIQELTARFEALNTHVDQRMKEVEAKLSAGFADVLLALRGPRS
ncbi:hypothetical protein C8J57DRAFT_1736598 [Mycena rebaudengoi]|nr:hypothetical protein C8J57DRAFT_1736598 [Mycena rebaudengoi]